MFCQNRWIISELIQKTETEKFLEEQAKRPQVVVDTTTETDRQLMDMIGGVFGAVTGGCMNRAIRLIALLIILVIVVIIGVTFCSINAFVTG
jgi:t-SNARE complex subunit (syntaxin)